MKVSESCCILQTIVDVKNGKVSLKSLQYPVNINERAFRLSFMYNKMYCVFFSCLSSIGLKELVVSQINNTNELVIIHCIFSE